MRSNAYSWFEIIRPKLKIIQ